jgi:hypothetical protein
LVVRGDCLQGIGRREEREAGARYDLLTQTNREERERERGEGQAVHKVRQGEELI